MSKIRARALVVGLVIASITVAVAAPGGSSAAPSARKTLTHSVSSFAKPSMSVGSAQGKVPVSVALKWSHAADLRRFTAAVSDPSSSSFRHFLSASAFRARYSPSAKRVAAVESFLRSHGFRVTGASKSRVLVHAVGSVSAAEHAFGTQLERYQVGHRVLRGTATPVSIPGSVRGDIAAVVGLDQAVNHHFSHAAPPPAAFKNARPCSKFWGQNFSANRTPPNHRVPHAYGAAQPFAPCGYTPSQLQSAYGVDDAINSGNDGSGQTVGIIDAFAAPTIVADVNQYSSRHGLPPANITQTNSTDQCQVGCGPNSQNGWYGEETLDLEAVHSMAPNAAIHYYGAADPSAKALLDTMSTALDDNDADYITNSYGSLGEQIGTVPAQEELFQQAIAQGVGTFFSSGDNGDEHTTIGYVSADYPGSSPLTTSVGGTSLGVGPTGDRTFETTWGTHIAQLKGKPGSKGAHWAPSPPGPFLYGGGGGTSRLFAEPSYQDGIVPPEYTGLYGGDNRVTPDISLDGDPTTGMLVGETQTFPSGAKKYDEYRIGGTSLSSPLMAGYIADAGTEAGGRIGFLNPQIYSLADSSPQVFSDIVPSPTKMAAVRNDFNNGVNDNNGTTFTLRSIDRNTSLKAAPGYDDATGIGTPAGGAALIDALSH
jgi:subtilase family serine protease